MFSLSLFVCYLAVGKCTTKCITLSQLEEYLVHTSKLKKYHMGFWIQQWENLFYKLTSGKHIKVTRSYHDWQAVTGSGFNLKRIECTVILFFLGLTLWYHLVWQPHMTVPQVQVWRSQEAAWELGDGFKIEGKRFRISREDEGSREPQLECWSVRRGDISKAEEQCSKCGPGWDTKEWQLKTYTQGLRGGWGWVKYYLNLTKFTLNLK
jgi:hypothetical protein